MKMLIKKNDIVKVISGDDKGKEGRVIETHLKKQEYWLKVLIYTSATCAKALLIQMVALWKENFQLLIQM